MFSLSVIVSLLACAGAELMMVQVVFRHGDRAPSFTYPSDKSLEVEVDFPRGLSQLTKRGYDQAQELGEYLKYRYIDQYQLLSRYNRRDVYVRSSDKDRCIETANGVVSALFTDQIVPVHTYSNHWTDLLLKPNSVKCEQAEILVAQDKRILRTSLNSEFSDLFQFLSDKTGWHVDAGNIEDVYNVLFRKHSNGLPQPKWVSARYGTDNHTVLDTVIELKRQVRMESFNSAQKSKLRTGFLLSQIGRNIREKTKKMFLYSTHDATLTSLLYNLDISNDQLPPYAGTIIFELHNVNGEEFVKILYRNTTNSEPPTLTAPFCDTMCPLATFQKEVDLRGFSNEADFHKACAIPPQVLPRKTEEKTTQTGNILDYVIPPLALSQISALVYFYMNTVSKEYLH